MAPNREEILRQLRESDEFGLLNSDSQFNAPSQKASPLLVAFEEIVDFYEDNNRLPECDPHNLKEFQLYYRYKAICRDKSKLNALTSFDLHHILADETDQIPTIEAIRYEDVFNLLDDNDSDIFTLRHVAERMAPEYISRRKFCHDFAKYEEEFRSINEDLKNRRRRLVKYDPILLKPGSYFVLNGILLFLKSVEGDYQEFAYSSGARNRFDGRTEVIFDNGTTSDMLFRSLDKALQKDGYAISDVIDTAEDTVSIDEDDCQNGYIYILKTKHPKLSKYDNLYKIGCTTSSVSERIRNSKNEATYLFAEVEVVSSLRCYNIVPEDLEDRIHRFFNLQRLDIQISDKNNNLFRPREWFVVNIKAVKDAIGLILRNEEAQYAYDPIIQQIIKV